MVVVNARTYSLVVAFGAPGHIALKIWACFVVFSVAHQIVLPESDALVSVQLALAHQMCLMSLLSQILRLLSLLIRHMSLMSLLSQILSPDE